MRNPVVLSSTDTDDPFFRWSALRTAATLAHPEGTYLEQRRPVATIHVHGDRERYFAMLGESWKTVELSDWAPRPNMTAYVSSAEGIESNRYYVVQIPAASWKSGDFAPGDWISSAAVTVPHVDSPLQSFDVENEFSIEEMERYYEVVNSGDVQNFLRHNSEITRLLLDAVEPLTQCFPEIDRLILELFHDPESEDVRELVCSIVTKLDPEKALEQLDQFDKSWFLARVNSVPGMLNFRLDFI